MTRKSLILVLVLCLASASYGIIYGDNRDNFELQLSGGTLTVVGKATDAIAMGVFTPSPPPYYFSGSGSILPDGAGGWAAGALSLIHVYSSGGVDGIEFFVQDTTPSTDPVDLMPWYTVAYSGFVGDIVDVYDDIGSSYTYLGTMEVIPEPTTLMLLGLGALFLRRRTQNPS